MGKTNMQTTCFFPKSKTQVHFVRQNSKAWGTPIQKGQGLEKRCSASIGLQQELLHYLLGY